MEERTRENATETERLMTEGENESVNRVEERTSDKLNARAAERQK